MRNKLLTFICILSFVPFVGAQVQTPQPSPHSKIEQVVGLTNVSVEYSRPGVKERTIFGDLIPYGELWRTGANENTKITFSDDVVINGETLKKGTYAIYTKPGKNSWEVLFYGDTDNWGVPKEWDEKKVVLQTEVKSVTLPFKIETFTLMFDNLKNNSATLNFVWENTAVSLDFQVPTEEKTMKSIETTMKGEPTANDYYAAASYYFSEGKNLEQALEWMQSAVKMMDNPPYYILRNKSLLEAKLGMKDAAIKSAQQSLKAAQKAEATHYIEMNKASLKEWGAL